MACQSCAESYTSGVVFILVTELVILLEFVMLRLVGCPVCRSVSCDTV